MKRILFSLSMIFCLTGFLYAQSPQSFKYQAVARDAMNQPIVSQAIGLRFSILESGPTGTIVYAETQEPMTTDLGIFSVSIGTGTVQNGIFSTINWATSHFWLQVEMDASGGNNFQLMGSSQILSVPYALHAATVSDKNDADADPGNEIQSLSFDNTNNQLSISGGNTIPIPTGGTDADADPTNEIQQLDKIGNQVTLSKNGGGFIDDVEDADSNPSNELQTLSFNNNNNELSISNGNSIVLPNAGNDNWSLTGNAGIDEQLNFIGTTDENSLILRSNNINRIRINPDGVIDFPGFSSVLLQSTGDLFGSPDFHIKSSDEFFAGFSTIPATNLYLDGGAGNDFEPGNILLGARFNGKVGIGTAYPNYKMELVNNGYGFAHTDEQLTLATYVDDYEGAALGTMQERNLHFFTNAGDFQMTLSTNKNVGIGTTDPNYKLEVYSRGYGIIHTDGFNTLGTYLEETGGASIGTISNHDLHFFTWNDAPQMTISRNKNVGIGVDDPETKLHVVGGTEATMSDPNGGFVTVGSPYAKNVVIDEDEIMARDNQGPATLHLQEEGGDVYIGGDLKWKARRHFYSLAPPPFCSM